MADTFAFLPAFIAHSINTSISVLLMAWPYQKARCAQKRKLWLVSAAGCLYGLVFFGHSWQLGDAASYFTMRTYILKLFVLALGFVLLKTILRASFWQLGFVSSVMGQYVAGVSAVSSDFVYCITGTPPAFLMDWVHLGSLVALVALTLPLMLLFSTQIIPLISVDQKIVRWPWLCVIPFLFNLIFNSKFYRGGFLTYGRGSWKDLALALLWFAATYGAYAIVLYSLNRAVQTMQLKEQVRLLQLQSDMHREQNAHLCEYADDVRRAEHDVRHHFLALRGLADEQDCAGIQRYLDGWNPSHHNRQVVACANPALEAVVNYYMARAQLVHAATSGTIELPATLGTAESDVCMVMGNLTENALDALQRQPSGEKFLRVNAKLTRENLLSVCVENSCCAPPVYHGGQLWSSKRDSAGVGTASVSAVAAARQGFAHYNEADGVFTAFVCMSLGELAHSV